MGLTEVESYLSLRAVTRLHCGAVAVVLSYCNILYLFTQLAPNQGLNVSLQTYFRWSIGPGAGTSGWASIGRPAKAAAAYGRRGSVWGRLPTCKRKYHQHYQPLQSSPDTPVSAITQGRSAQSCCSRSRRCSLPLSSHRWPHRGACYLLVHN